MRPSRVLVVLLALAFLAPLAPAQTLPALPGAPQDPCAGRDDAGSGSDTGDGDRAPIARGVAYAGCLSFDFEVDAYQFDVSPGERIDWTLTSEECAYFDIMLLADEGPSNTYEELAYGVAGCEGAYVADTAAYGGTYWIRVNVDPSYEVEMPVDYSFVLRAGDLPDLCLAEDDAGAGHDADRATPVALTTTTVGCLHRYERTDTYTYSVPEDDLLTRITFVDASCMVAAVWPGVEGAHDAGTSYVVTEGAPGCGSTIVGLEGYGGAETSMTYWRDVREGRYDIVVERAASFPRLCASQDDASSGRDAKTVAPVPLPDDGRATGCADEFDGRDAFAVDLAAGERIQLGVEGGNCNGVWPVIEDSDGNRIGSLSGCSPTSFRTDAPRTVHAVAERTFGLHDYTLVLKRCIPAPPSGSTVPLLGPVIDVLFPPPAPDCTPA